MKKLIALFAVMGTVAAFGAAATGNCPSKAVALKASQTVKLVNEWDPDIGFLDMGAYYYKVKLTKGIPYTIWMTGGSTADMELMVYSDWEDDNAPMASFMPEEFQDGLIKAQYLFADEWSEDDPSSGTYYIQVSGEIGQTANLFFTAGIQSFIREGEEGNPKRITFTQSAQTQSASLLETGEYYFIASLEAGRKYRFRLNSGGASSPLALDVYGADYWIDNDPSAPNAPIKLIYPGETADYTFHVYSTNDNLSASAQSFSIAYYTYATRLPADHDNVIPLTSANGHSAEVQPGREVADAEKYYDAVIDESLCSISVAKGERWVFQTEGGAIPMLMRVYDSAGRTLNENTGMGNGSFETRTAVVTSYDGYYYVGVCDPLLDVVSVPTAANVRLFAKRAEEFNGPGDYDEFDPVDDVYGGATMLVAYPGSVSNRVVDVAKPNGPHVLSGGDWYDWYVLPCRNGITYALKAAFSSLDTSDVRLNAAVYKQVGSVRTKVSTVGSLVPDEVQTEEDTAPLTFTADEDAMYYVCVYAGTGGHDYPAHDIYAMAYHASAQMGLLNVVTKGVDGTWSVSQGGFQYPSGATVVVPANRQSTVYFPAVSGFKATSSAVSKEVEQYIAGEQEEIASVTGIYTDEYDHRDDVYTGFAKITPAKTTAKALRTLWTDDPADHFCFSAHEGLYYNFAIIDRNPDEYSDVVFSIHHVTGTSLDDPLAEDLTSFLKKGLAAGTYIIKASHYDDASRMDSAYSLVYNCVDVGTVQFAAKSFTASEDAAYVDVVLTRTSSEGAVRVNFATEAFTAKPGSEYYPTNGILSWAAGDSAPKAIRVRLIPDLRDKWEERLYFGVNIWPMAEDSWGDGEYGAVISGTTKVPVVLTESSAKTTGTIAVKAAPAAVAGTPATVTLSRTGGVDGSVGVVVATIADTARKGVDFDAVQTNIVWEAGDGGDKTFEVPTHANGARDALRFKLRLASLKTTFPAQYGDIDNPAAISSENTTATILSAEQIRSLEDLMTEPTLSGIAATRMAGDLYVDSTGALRSSVVPPGGKVMFKFRVDGPGLFVMEPRLENPDAGSSFLFQVSGGAILDCSSGDRLVVPVGPGGRNIAFVARSPSGTAYASLQPLTETGLPFKWVPFSSVKTVFPRDMAVVDASIPALAWTAPVGLAGEEVWYRVQASAKGTDPATFTAILTNMTTDTSCEMPEGLLRAGRQFWWRVDYAYIGAEKEEPEQEDWMEGPSVWTFRTAAAGAAVTVPSALAVDVNGTSVAALLAKGEPVEAVQGARVDFSLAAESGTAVKSSSIVAGELPPGVKLTSAGRVYGIPKSAGDYSALVQVNGGTTLALDVHVAALESAAGSFCGVLQGDGPADGTFGRIGVLSFTCSEAGVFSAKAKVGNVVHAFSGSGYEEVIDRDDSAAGQTMQLKATLQEAVSIGGLDFANVLEVTVGSGSPDNPVALGQSAGSARLVVNIDDNGTAREVEYRCELVRRNADSELFVSAMAPFVGYYTMTLVPYGATAAAGLPCGNGPMAITVSRDGSVKASGVLPDKTSFSSSSFCGLRGDVLDPANAELVVPLAFAAYPNSIGGLLRVKFTTADIGGLTDRTSYVDSWKTLEWNKSGGAFDGSDFSLSVCPVGGWYDTVLNLQRYYLDLDLSVEAESVEGIPDGMLPAGYTYTVDTVPHGVAATLAGNSLSVAPRVVVKDGSRVDLSRSVNAWNVTISFKRGSGLVSGTADVVSDGAEQKVLGAVSHYGILLMNRDPKAPLDLDVWTAGFYQFPASNGWRHSLPFNIKSLSVDRDWSEAELPPAE